MALSVGRCRAPHGRAEFTARAVAVVFSMLYLLHPRGFDSPLSPQDTKYTIMAESTKSTKPKGLYQKLLELQKSVKGLAKNEQAYGYQYVSGSKLLYFVRPMMDELGLLLLPSTKSFSSEIVKTREAGMKGNKPVEAKYENLVTLTKTFTWVDAETGEKADFDFTAQGCNDWDKGAGSAETYAERYFLLKFFHIATDADDVDAIHNDAPAEAPQSSAPATQQSVVEKLNAMNPNFYSSLVQTAAENPDAEWEMQDGRRLNSWALFMSYLPTDQEVKDFENSIKNYKELFANNK